MAVIIDKYTARAKTGFTKTMYKVLCTCGYENIFNAFSWGLNGHLKCKRCQVLISKRSTEWLRIVKPISPNYELTPQGTRLYYAKTGFFKLKNDDDT